MRFQISTTRVLLPIGLLVALGISACAYEPYYTGPAPRTYGTYYYPYDYDYYYYPYARVYFQYSTGYYYYRDGNRWERSRSLPPRYHLDPRTRVNIRVKDPKPYIHDGDHYRKYAPRKQYTPQPRYDRQERDHNRRTYEIKSKERQQYIKQHDKDDRRNRR